MRAPRRSRRLVPMAAAGLAAAVLVLAASGLGALDRLELDSVDARFGLRGARPAPGFVVVAIDDVTFSELGRRWPFPRSLHARAIDRLRAAGARGIAYDVQFTEPTSPSQDLALYEAVRRAGGVVLSTTESDGRGRTNVLGGEENLAAARARAASTNLPVDPGGVIRRLPASADGLETFGAAAARAVGRPARLPSGEEAWIDYHGPPGTVATVPFSRLLAGRVPEAALRGKVAVVGAAAPSLQDVHPTATSGGEVMAGPEVQANAISTAVRGFPLRSAPGWLEAAAVLALGLVAPLAGARLTVARTGLLAAGLLGAWGVACQLAFGAGTVLPFVAPAASVALAAVGALAAGAVLEGRERRLTRMLFSRFVGEEVVGELLDRAGGDVRLGGVRQTATVLFCDLRGFTSFAESLPAERVIEVLNRYLSEMSDAILDHGGTLVSYLGDGIMAVFGSPLERADHAEAALAAAREMAGPRLERFNAWLREEGLGNGFRIGIGVNSGPVMSGNVGSERRLEYAAVGDTTNVAARIEALTKELDHAILLSAATRALVPEDEPGLRPIGEVEVPGRRAPLALFAAEPVRAEAAEAGLGRRRAPALA